jgi:hypothetical protein
LIEALVALFEVQVRLVVLPTVIEAGLATSVQVGFGSGITVSVALQDAVPPVPVTVAT